MTAFKGLGTYGDAVGVVTPLDHKLAMAACVTKTTTPLAVRPGVFFANTATLVTGAAGMTYNVAAYECVTQRSAAAGVVFGGNDGTLSVATTAAPGSNSRYDVVYHWHREFSLDGADSNPVIGVVQGVAAASPTVPSLAAFPGAIELARILVPAGVTATNSGTTITQTAPFTSMDGGKYPVRTTAERDLITTARTDQEVLCLADGVTYKWNGSSWLAWESDWIAFTATLANFGALGTGGAAAGAYKFAHGMCDWYLDINWGAGLGQPSTGWGFTLPAAIRTALAARSRKIGAAVFRDASAASAGTITAHVDLDVLYETAAGVAQFRQPYSGASAITDYGYLSQTLSGLPTVASGDYLTASGRFPV